MLAQCLACRPCSCVGVRSCFWETFDKSNVMTHLNSEDVSAARGRTVCFLEALHQLEVRICLGLVTVIGLGRFVFGGRLQRRLVKTLSSVSVKVRAEQQQQASFPSVPVLSCHLL